MTLSNSFLLLAVEAMASVAPVSYRRIFNGYGIYHQGVQFAIIIHDQLYFRADHCSRDLYLAKKMAAFQPCALNTLESNFFQLPDEVLQQPAELIYWMRLAVEAAQNAYAMDGEETAADKHRMKNPVRQQQSR
jgi:DNA transformation protein and related proteins